MSIIQNQLTPSLDYAGILGRAEKDDAISYLLEELPQAWFEAYCNMTPRKTNVCRFPLGSFEYLFDDLATLEAMSEVPSSADNESRVVAAIGICKTQSLKRDDYRLKGWVGPTEKRFGKEWDKGHFIAHSIGGAVDQWEVNVFQQRRVLNRGWAGAKRYREMETFCAANPGVLCFSRPIYFTGLSLPCIIEFGVLRPDGSWWIEQFDNR